MSFPKLTEARARLNAKRDELGKIFAEAGPDMDMAKVTSLSGEANDKLDQIRARNTEINDIAAEVAKLLEIEKAAKDSAARESVEAGSEPGDLGNVLIDRKSLGQLFVASDAFKGFRGGAGPVGHLTVPEIRNTLFEKAAGWAPESTRTGIVTLYPTRPAPHVVDFIPVLPTKQAAVKYMEETTFTNSAAEAAEGAAYGESALALTERSKTVEKIAVFLPATDEQLEDADEAAAYVDQRLVFQIQQRLDLQVMVGDGSTPNLLGTEAVSGIQTQALGVLTIPDAIYKAMRKIRDDGFAEPSVVFIRPEKWETVRLLKDTAGTYVWGHPSAPGPDTIFGVPVVQTTAVTATKAVLGDYLNFAALYIKRGVDVQVSNSHSDFFVKGKQAIRADMRCAMVHYRPKAFATVTGL